MLEKRSFGRLDIIGLAQIKHGASSLPLEAQIVDISYDGMRIYVKEPIAGSVEILIRHLGNEADKQIGEAVKGQVAWIKKKGLWYSVGVQFENLNPMDHTEILTFLDRYVKIK